jgi:hypothetical protein
VATEMIVVLVWLRLFLHAICCGNLGLLVLLLLVLCFVLCHGFLSDLRFEPGSHPFTMMLCIFWRKWREFVLALVCLVSR